MKTPNTAKAVKSLEGFIKEQLKDDHPDKVKVYHYKDQGFRIAEISSTRGSGGCSWMRSECPALILAAEQFVLTFGEKPYKPKGWESFIDNHADAKDQIIEHIK